MKELRIQHMWIEHKIFKIEFLLMNQYLLILILLIASNFIFRFINKKILLQEEIFRI